MKLSVVIPAFNENLTIAELIRRVKAVNLSPIELEVIVVDDGSTDGTREFLSSASGLRCIFHEKNQGKGGAVKSGFAAATGDILLIQDADLEYDPNDYPAMIRPILEGRADMTIGVRIQPNNDLRRATAEYWLRRFGLNVITWVTNWLYWNDAADYEGCYKAFRRELIAAIPIETNNFDFDNELVCKALRHGYRSENVLIRYYPRDYAAGKKIRWTHGFLILWTIVKWRFLPLNYRSRQRN